MFKILFFIILTVSRTYGILDISKLTQGHFNQFNASSKEYKYYTVEMMEDNEWVKREDYGTDAVEMLRNKHRSVIEIGLKKDFLFYGHRINTITLTSGGFIHVDELKHTLLTHSMYIAPFMANFYTSEHLTPPSHIHVFDNQTTMIIWWENMKVLGIQNFTISFQLVYYSNGTIIFNYKDKVSDSDLKEINEVDTEHAFKIGISDARYLTHDLAMNFQVQLMLPYHTVAISLEELKKHSRFVITPLPTCVENEKCAECVLARQLSHLDCTWCPKLNMCSDGLDRFSQKWMDGGCQSKTDLITDFNTCVKHGLAETSDPLNPYFETLTDHDDNNTNTFIKHLDYKTIFLKILIIILFILSFSICFVVLVLRIRNTNTYIGRWFVENRLSRVIRRYRERGSRVRSRRSGLENSVLGRINFSSDPNYVSFRNTEETPLELPQQLTNNSPLRQQSPHQQQQLQSPFTPNNPYPPPPPPTMTKPQSPFDSPLLGPPSNAISAPPTPIFNPSFSTIPPNQDDTFEVMF